MLNQAQIDELCTLIGHRFEDDSLLRQAFKHASVAETRVDSNERMEFLGDAVLGLIACERIFNLHPDLLEGEMTKIKSMVVSRQTCAEIAEDLDLERFLLLGKGMRGKHQLPASLAAATIEAVVGAVYIDGGYEAARRFLTPLVDPYIEQAYASGHQRNYKSVLQQHAQRSLNDAPVYLVLDEQGPDHAKCFEVCVELGGQRYPSRWGQTKKQAEQAAALAALHTLQLIVEDDGSAALIAESK